MKGITLIALLPALAAAEHVRGVDPACEYAWPAHVLAI